MSIQSFIKKVKKKRALKKAEETGSTLASQGVTQSTSRTTTGEYVVPSDGGVKVVSPSGSTSSYIPSSSSGSKRSGGTSSSSGGGTPVVTPAPQQEFSGKVEQIDTKTGEPVETKYYVKGKETGRIFDEKGQTYAETKTPSKFTFGDKERKFQEVEFGSGETKINEYEMIVGDRKSDMMDFSGLSLESPSKSYDYGQGSRTDFGKGIDTQIYSPGTTYAIQTGEFKKVPTYDVYTVKEDWSSSIASDEEMKRLFPSEVTKGEGRKTKVGASIGEFKGKTQKLFEEPTGTLSEDILVATESKGKFVKGVGGFASGLVPETKGELLKTGVSFGIGAGLGVVVKGGGIALSYIPRVGKYAVPTFKGASIIGGGALTGIYTEKTIRAVSIESEPFRKGEIIGESVLELGAIGLGYGAGSKLASKGYGLIRTKGRIEIPLERMTRPEVISGKESFPTAPPSQQLKLFKETTTKLPELTEGTPGGFHATPEQFWGKEIVPSAGTSELPGLYVSSEASIHFAKIQGGGYSLKLPNIKSITQGEKPALAFLKPKGFREVGFQEVSPYKIGEQEFRYSFVKEAKEGYIDIPKMKTEIEGIARPNAGKYVYESGKYYTKIKGERVPIDVFKSETGEIKMQLKKGTKLEKGFSSEEYGYLPEDTSLIDYRSSLGKLRSSYKRGYSKTSVSYLPSSSSISRSLSRISYSPYSKRILKSYSSYSPSSRSYFGSSFRSISGGSSTSLIVPYSQISSISKPQIFKLPKIHIPEQKGIIRAERLFIETPTFGTVLGKELGIKFKTQKLGGYSGLGEREFKTGIKLPTTVLKTVQTKEFETLPKIKSYVRSVI